MFWLEPPFGTFRVFLCPCPNVGIRPQPFLRRVQWMAVTDQSGQYVRRLGVVKESQIPAEPFSDKVKRKSNVFECGYDYLKVRRLEKIPRNSEKCKKKSRRKVSPKTVSIEQPIVCVSASFVEWFNGENLEYWARTV